MANHEVFQKSFLPPSPPESITVITGDQQEIEQRTHTFFVETLDFLGVTPDHIRAGYAERKAYFLAHPVSEQVTDQIATLLIVTDKAVASALELRNDNNWVVGVWASYLNPEMEETVRRRLPQMNQDQG